MHVNTHGVRELMSVYLLFGVLMLKYVGAGARRAIRADSSYYTILYVCGTLVGFAGLAFIALHFVPVVEPPS